MNDNMSRVVMVVLGVALVIAAIFAFNQTNSLNETATELANIESEGTQFAQNAFGTVTQGAANLGDANSSGTQSAESAAGTSTQNAVEIADANDSGTQSAESAAGTATQGSVNLDSANATATQSAADAADVQGNLEATGTQYASDLSDVEAEATESAEMIANLEAESTENAEIIANLEADATTGAENLAGVESDATAFADSANATATQLSGEVADAVATAVALTVDLDASEETVSTLEADLEAANETINAQATTIAGIDKEDEDDDADDDDNTDASSEDGFVLFETDDFSLLMPEDFIVFDLRTDQDEAIETFDEMGLAYAWLADNAREGAEDGFKIIGARDTPDGLFDVDAFLMDTDTAIAGFDAEAYVDFLSDFFEDEGFEVIEDGTVELDGPDPAYIIVESGEGLVELIYVYVIDGNLYLMFYETSEDKFDDVREEFEISAQSLIVHD